LNGNETITRSGNMHPTIVPYGVYKAKDDYIMLGAASQTQFEMLCDITGLSSIKADARFLTNEFR
jgi:crotonobetainyl-CoA:carnitine CoA-transferase CaiB-like acyl-CoA transferase